MHLRPSIQQEDPVVMIERSGKNAHEGPIVSSGATPDRWPGICL